MLLRLCLCRDVLRWRQLHRLQELCELRPLRQTQKTESDPHFVNGKLTVAVYNASNGIANNQMQRDNVCHDATL